MTKRLVGASLRPRRRPRPWAIPSPHAHLHRRHDDANRHLQNGGESFSSCRGVPFHLAGTIYVLRWPELQRVLINGYRGYLKRHGGRRPRRADSFHTALREPDIKSFLDNWSLFDAFTEVSKTDPGAPDGPSAPH